MRRTLSSLTYIFVLSLSFLNLSSNQALAQVYDGNLYLSSQADVDAFNYTEVTGSVNISGADIVDLSALEPLTSIGRYLSISDNEILTKVNGLNNLKTIGGGISVYSNPKLQYFVGFNALESTGDNIDFWYNEALIAVDGFASMHTVGWSLEFGGSPNLVKLPDFTSLKTIKSSLFIMDNPALPAITGFNALAHVDWSFVITGNSALTSLCGFYNFASSNPDYTGGGAIDISGNHAELAESSSMQSIIDGGACKVDPPAPPEDPAAIEDVIAAVKLLDLSKKIKNSMVRDLKNAARQLSRGNVDAAKAKLQAVANQISDLLSSGAISEEQGNAVLRVISEVMASL
jgi:hypothetical protein